MFNHIEIAKYAVNATVKAVAAGAVANLITNNTEKTEDDKIVKIGSTVAGWYIGDALRSHTDKMVDKTAAAITKFKNRKEITE